MPILTFRVSEEEHKRLAFEAKAAKISMSELVRMRALQPTTVEDFETYKMRLQTDFQRMKDLLCDVLATIQFLGNVDVEVLKKVNPQNAQTLIQHFGERLTAQKKELKGDV